MRRYMDFFRDKNLCEGGNNDGPEYWHGGAHDCEVDFEAGYYECKWIPPSEVETLNVVRFVLESGPKTEDGHENDSA